MLRIHHSDADFDPGTSPVRIEILYPLRSGSGFWILSSTDCDPGSSQVRIGILDPIQYGYGILYPLRDGSGHWILSSKDPVQNPFKISQFYKNIYIINLRFEIFNNLTSTENKWMLK